MWGGGVEGFVGVCVWGGEGTGKVYVLGVCMCVYGCQSRPSTHASHQRNQFQPYQSINQPTQVLVYLSYMSIFASGLYFAMGAIGFAASGLFVVAIMKAVKAE